MKTYIKPDTSLYQLKGVTLLTDASTAGVQNDDTVQDEYDSEDVSYSRPITVWDEQE